MLIGVVLIAYLGAVAFSAGPLPTRVIDSLKIFPSAFPGYDSAQAWEYNLARYLAAAVFLYGSLRLLSALLSDRITELRASLRTGHAVVCGLDEIGWRCVQALRAEGKPVTCLVVAADGEYVRAARSLGALVLRRDATDHGALVRARVTRAEHVICAGPTDQINTSIAAQVALITHAEGAESGPHVHVKVTDADLTRVIRGPLMTLGAARLHFFNVSELWARLLLDYRPVASEGHHCGPRRIAVIGGTEVARALVAHAARRQHATRRAAGHTYRLGVHWIAEDAQRLADELRDRYPRIGEFTDLETVEVAGPHPRAETQHLGRPECAYVCLADANQALATSLALDRQLGGRVPVLLAQTEGVTALGPFLADVTNVHPVPLPRTLPTELIHDQASDAIAREIHSSFLAQRRKAADFGNHPADVEWALLPARHRRASQQHADAVVDQMRAAWLELDSCDDWDAASASLPRDALEAMAQMEHARWCRALRREGWKLAAVRDEPRRRHDLLVPWADLPESARDLTRSLVQSRPELLLRAGLTFVVSPNRDRLARLVHERYRARSADRGHSVPTWDDLPEEARQWNYATVDHIPVKLAAVGCRIAPRTLGDSRAATLTAAEVEAMARLEHDRWCAERLSGGWARGPRDDLRHTHPSLGPWGELSSLERQKDRDVVRDIPELLSEVGQIMIRMPN